MTENMVIFWFRRDLRLSDNMALLEAVKKEAVLPIYILDEREEFRMGGASKWWLHHSLIELNKSLDGNLHFFKGDAATLLPQLANTMNAKAVYWNRCYEPGFLKNDALIETALAKNNIASAGFDGTLLWRPGDIVKKDATPYKIYTPFMRACLDAELPHYPLKKPDEIIFSSVKPPHALPLKELSLLPTIGWDDGIAKSWTPGEDAAIKMLRSFIADKLEYYNDGRDYPARDVLSRLSPYLHFGEISPNQVLHEIHDANYTIGEPGPNVQKFIRELIWREFSCHVLFHFPETAVEIYQPRLKKIKWQTNSDLLKKWQQGLTGVPIVDAGMRQLWQTGYMHNRVRMITASFLVKNLLMDWRVGADWFFDCLVDADLAVNTMNWQWVAGSGLDAAPFFRIFNSVLQSKKFDVHGDYIKSYVPGLANLPASYIHEPWKAPANIPGVTFKIGKDYPLPCIDLQGSAQAALAAYQKTG